MASHTPGMSLALDADQRDRDAAQRLGFLEQQRFVWILRWMPVLWLTGAMSLVTIVTCLVACGRRGFLRHLLDPAILTWFGVGVVQVLCTAVAWSNAHEGIGVLLYRCCSAPISGWVVIPLVMAIGRRSQLANEEMGNAVCRLGIYLICIGAPLLLAATLLHITDLVWLTPIGHLIPSRLPSARFEFSTQFVIEDDLVGSTLPRIVLFYPWPTCLGMAGAAVFFIALSQSPSKLSWAGRVGGLFAIFASFSRAAILATLVGLLAYGFTSQRRQLRALSAFAAALMAIASLCVILIFGGTPTSTFHSASAWVSNLRTDSSNARAELYAETMRQFHQEPILGHGWQGDILDPYIPLNIGSHSTIYGLLYTGGVVTLAAYVLAVLALGARLLRMARRKGRCQAALSIFIVVIIMSYGECIYSFGIPLFFAFGWMGSCLVADPVEEKGDAGAMRRLPQIAEAARA